MATTKTVKATTKKQKRDPKPPQPLSAKVETFLAKNTGKTFTYNQVAKRLKVKAVAVANATRTLRKSGSTLASAIVTSRQPVAKTLKSVVA